MKKLLPHLLFALLVVGCAFKQIEIKEEQIEIKEEQIEIKEANKQIAREQTETRMHRKFIPYDKPPKPIIPIKPIYPKAAKESGIEGTVYIELFIDKQGNVKEALVQKGIPNTGLNKAALSAVNRSKWKPAYHREKAVGIWLTIPVKFKLN